MHWRRKWHPLQCSCLENLRDGGASWAAVYGVAQSRTRLKRPSSSSSSSRVVITFLPRSKCLLILWQQSPSAVILEPCILYLLSISVSGICPSGALDLLHLLIQKLRECLRNMIGTKQPVYGTVSIMGNRQWKWGHGAWWGLLTRPAGVTAWLTMQPEQQWH